MVNVHKLLKSIFFLHKNKVISAEERLEWTRCAEHAQDVVIKNILALPDSPAKAAAVDYLDLGGSCNG